MIEFIGIVYLLLATTFKGLMSFIGKSIAEKKFNSELITIYFYIFSLLISSIVFIIKGNYSFQNFTFSIFLLIFISSIFLVFSIKISLKSLNELSSSVFFVNTRLISSIFLLIFSFYIFGELLTTKQFIGFFIGFFIFILLYDKKDKIKKNSNLKKGFIYLGLFIMIVIFTNLVSKYLGEKVDIISIVLMYNIFSILISSFVFRKSLKKLKSNKNKNLIKYSFIFALSNYLSFLAILKALTLIPLIIAYKIFSFEIFIPIILSFIFYKEKITYRKIIALVLTGVSFWFFLF
jgi:drug/metabolite transporter (DMT)-like permease